MSPIWFNPPGPFWRRPTRWGWFTVELIFRVHAEIRASEVGTFCIGGPAHSPHVAEQVRVAAGEPFNLQLSLTEGAYCLRGPQLPYSVNFRVTAKAPSTGWELLLSRRPPPQLPRSLRRGGQTFALINDTPQELIVRVERTAPRADAFTAARAMSLVAFRELFPGETLSHGQLVSVAQVSFLVTELADVASLYRERGDAKAFACLHEHLRLTEQLVRQEGGAVVKALEAGLLAAFHEPGSAVRAALEATKAVAAGETSNRPAVRCGIHRGPAMTATINDRLDYFGTTVNTAMRLPGFANPGEAIVTRAVAADLQVIELLVHKRIEPETISMRQPLGDEPVLFRLRRGP
jgi:eukaryotic-like serine/threonine-protein kinase